MIRLVAVAFALVLATSVQAMPVAPLHQPAGMTTQVRMACGAGRVRGAASWAGALGVPEPSGGRE
jgi:NhaP-type Na+/H+ or K+/H+ antiporter